MFKCHQETRGTGGPSTSTQAKQVLRETPAGIEYAYQTYIYQKICNICFLFKLGAKTECNFKLFWRVWPDWHGCRKQLSGNTFDMCRHNLTWKGKRVSFEGEQGVLPLRKLPSVPILSQVRGYITFKNFSRHNSSATFVYQVILVDHRRIRPCPSLFSR